MAEHIFTCTDKGTEYPDRFAGHEVRYNVPEAVPGDVNATLANIQERIDGEADAADVLASYFNGYGLTYSVNGLIKRFLNSDEAAKLDTDAAIAEATKRANEYRVGAPVKRSGGGKKSKAVQEAEAKVATQTNALRESYLAAPASVRKYLRGDLVARGIFTEEQLDEMDAE